MSDQLFTAAVMMMNSRYIEFLAFRGSLGMTSVYDQPKHNHCATVCTTSSQPS